MARQLTADALNRLWAVNINYLRSWEGRSNLAVVVDAFSRRVVGWALTGYPRTELVLDAVGMAILTRKPGPGLVQHTDRRWQYTVRQGGCGSLGGWRC